MHPNNGESSPNSGSVPNLVDSLARLLPKSPTASAAVGFAAGVGIGAVIVHVLANRSADDPILGRLGQQALDGLQSIVPKEFAQFVPGSDRAAG